MFIAIAMQGKELFLFNSMWLGKVVSLNLFFFKLLVTISEETLMSCQYAGYNDDHIGIPLKYVENSTHVGMALLINSLHLK